MTEPLQTAPLVETELLRTFTAVVELRSFTKAAAKLGLSQPAVSGHIKRLQDQLATDLFDKSAPGVRLTEHGQTVLAYARDILAKQSELFNRINQRADREQTIRIGIPLEMRCAQLVPSFVEFRNTHPVFAIAITRGTPLQLEHYFDNGDVDLYIGISTTASSGAQWTLPDSHAWVVAQDMTEISTDPLELVLPAGESLTEDLVVGALDSAKIPYRKAVSLHTIEAITAATRMHLGVSAVLKSQLRDEHQLREIDSLPSLPKVFWSAIVNNERASRVYTDLAQAMLGALTTAPTHA